MNDYILGIMWSIGTLQKGTNRYSVQTFDENKVYYLQKIADIKNKTVSRTERISRGKSRTMYSVFVSDADYANILRMLGYDDSEIEIPENASDSFMAAMLELNITIYDNNGSDFFRISSDDCEVWNKILNEKYNLSQKKIIKSSMDYIAFGKTEMIILADRMIKVKHSNKEFWNDIISRCQGKIK